MGDIAKIVSDLFRRGHTPDGVVFVLRLLAAEHEEGSDRRRELEVAALEILG